MNYNKIKFIIEKFNFIITNNYNNHNKLIEDLKDLYNESRRLEKTVGNDYLNNIFKNTSSYINYKIDSIQKGGVTFNKKSKTIKDVQRDLEQYKKYNFSEFKIGN